MFDIITEHDRVRKADGAAPPAAVRAACRRGLDLADEYGGPGLTDGAKARARSMAAGDAVSTDNLTRMASWFARHQQNRADPSAKEPTPGAVAWLIWGGDAGKSWVNKNADTQKSGKRIMERDHKRHSQVAHYSTTGKLDPEIYPKAYVTAVMGKITRNKSMNAQQLYRDFLAKAGGEGSRGGRVIGHTANGRAVYSHGGFTGSANHANPHYRDFSAEDHRDAAQAHRHAAAAQGSARSKSNENHSELARLHDHVAHHIIQSRFKSPDYHQQQAQVHRKNANDLAHASRSARAKGFLKVAESHQQWRQVNAVLAAHHEIMSSPK